MKKTTIKVGPFSQRELPHVWSWIYFHGKAEDTNAAYQDKLIKDNPDNWEAPDLVRSDTPIEEIADGRLIHVQHADGTEMFASIWSGDCEYRKDFDTGKCAFHARRRGLICNIDDEKSLDYAIDCFDKKKRGL